MSYGMPPSYNNLSYPSGYRPYAPPGRPADAGMTRIKQELGAGILNASRIPLDGKQLYGLQDGEPILRVHGRPIPTTGVPWVDRSVGKGEDVLAFVPQALGNSVMASLRGSLVGGIGAGVFTGIGAGLAKLLMKESQFGVGSWTAGLAVLGAMIGGGAGFAQSMYENLQDLKRLVFGVKPKP